MTIRAPMAAAFLVLSGWMTLAGGPAAAQPPPQVPRPPRVPLTPLKTPEYDLAILKIGTGLRWQGGLAEFAILDVSIVSNGLRDVRQPDVECLVAGKTFRSLSGGALMRRGEPYQFAVQVSGREAFEISAGDQPATCTARIVQPRDARDGNPANDTLSGVVRVEPPPRPDLIIRSIELRDCETRGAAVAGRPACAEVNFENSRAGAGIVTPWLVACDIGGVRASAPGVTPIDKGYVVFAIVGFEKLAAGEYDADCTVDAKNVLAETDETNNRRTDRVAVLGDMSGVQYDLAITGMGTTVSEARDETTKQPYVFMEVRLKNLGTQPILQADVRCELGTTGLAFLSLGSLGFQPGEEGPFKVQVWGRRLGQVPSGPHETTCAAGIVLPKAAVETTVENNVMTGTVVVRR
jgi:hypothetical protein